MFDDGRAFGDGLMRCNGVLLVIGKLDLTPFLIVFYLILTQIHSYPFDGCGMPCIFNFRAEG